MVKIIQPSSHFKLGSRGQVGLALINSQSIQHLGIFEKKKKIIILFCGFVFPCMDSSLNQTPTLFFPW